ncbi:hypothetical protein OsI_32825 [Oryza sativa Indica Group]|uniref:C2H2-type domain-containing protein n=1 Tax=Oryza sativa subsp. indica TaxID=39946 RepID=B8BFU4_ORYSI|nr:hypothetical protein OsI_32825 [Oryza sativa Indica Group]
MSPMRPRSSSASSTSPVAGKKEKTATKPAGGGARDPPKGRSSSFACRVCGKRFPSQQAMAGHEDHCRRHEDHVREAAAATAAASGGCSNRATCGALLASYTCATQLLAAAAVADWSQVAAGIPLSKEQLVVAVAIVVADDGQGQAAEVFLLDLAAEELNLGPSMNNEATSIPKALPVLSGQFIVDGATGLADDLGRVEAEGLAYVEGLEEVEEVDGCSSRGSANLCPVGRWTSDARLHDAPPHNTFAFLSHSVQSRHHLLEGPSYIVTQLLPE